jgi:hypothetical protein
MGRTAEDNERGEAKKDPVKREVVAAADKIDQRNGNGIVSGGDESVGENMEPDDARLPKITTTMRHETIVGEETSEKAHRPL